MIFNFKLFPGNTNDNFFFQEMKKHHFGHILMTFGKTEFSSISILTSFFYSKYYCAIFLKNNMQIFSNRHIDGQA